MPSFVRSLPEIAVRWMSQSTDFQSYLPYGDKEPPARTHNSHQAPICIITDIPGASASESLESRRERPLCYSSHFRLCRKILQACSFLRNCRRGGTWFSFLLVFLGFLFVFFWFSFCFLFVFLEFQTQENLRKQKEKCSLSVCFLYTSSLKPE